MERMTVNQKEYDVCRLLGKGKGGYSWLVSDGRERYVLKQIHHEPCDYYQFGDKMAAELNDYQCLSQIGIPLPRLIDADREQERILKEYIEGETIYEMVLRGALPSGCLEQVREMCSLLYGAGRNIDYFPTNFILQNAPDGRDVNLLTEQLAVSIFGTSGNVEAITGDDILVTVDLADFGSAVGTYTVPAEVTVLGRDVGVSGGPYRVRVTISEQTADQPAEPDVPAGENPDTGDETT